jgi:hypothetical protein
LRANEKEFRQRGAALAAVGLGDFASLKAFPWGDRHWVSAAGRPEARGAPGDGGKEREFVLPFAQRQFRSVLEPRLPRHLRYSLGKNPFQLGGSFVFRPGDVDRFVHVSENV